MVPWDVLEVFWMDFSDDTINIKVRRMGMMNNCGFSRYMSSPPVLGGQESLGSILVLGRQDVLELGDCPNIETKTLGGQMWWKILERRNGWVLQYNPIVCHARILDENDVRKAWGSEIVMREKFKRLIRAKDNTIEYFFETGDVIGVERNPLNDMGDKKFNMPGKLYEHYGIYIGDGMVMHYSEDGTDMCGMKRFMKEGTKAFRDAYIHKVSLKEFLRGDSNCFVLHFEKGSRQPRKIHARTNFVLGDSGCFVPVFDNKKEFRLYSPEETVERALSRLGDGKGEYNLVRNNCEHFAIWCKTGVEESVQVKRLILHCHSCKLPKVMS